MKRADDEAALRCVLVHGYMDGPAVWERLAGRLATLCAEVDTVPLAPVGDAQAPSARLLEAYARQVRAVCERPGDARRVVLIGHSLGGAVVELLAAQGLERLAGMVLLTPSPLRGVALPPEVMARFVARTALTDRSAIGEGKRGLAVSLDEAAEETLITSTLATGAAFAQEQLRAWTGGHPAGQGPAPFRIPVRMVTTDDRFFTAGQLAQEATRFARCTTAHVPGAGHWPQLEQPQRLAEVIAPFLRELAAGGAEA